MEENNILVNVEENKEETVDSKQDLYSKVSQAFYEELHSIIKGKIFVKIEERTDLKNVDSLFIEINNFGVKWNDRVKLYEGFVKLMSENRECVKTMAVQEYENYKRYVMTKFFVHENV